MKRVNQNLNTKIQIILGILLIICGLIIYLIPQIKLHKKKKLENSKVEEYIRGFDIDNTVVEESTTNKEKKIIKVDYLAVLEIPKINLKKGLYNINSKYNSINYGIEILKESEMPIKESSNLYLASHSGNSSISYFKHLNKLLIGDKVYLYYKGIKYEYIIAKIYQKTKDGTISVSNSNNNRIYLITCVDNKEQIIYTSILNNKEFY